MLDKNASNVSALDWTSKKQTLSLCFILFGLIFLVFGRAIFYPYVVLDDLYYLTQNKMILAGINWNSLHWAFTTFQTGDWQPLTWLSWMIPAHFFGLNPVVAHSINILLHTGNAILLFLVLKKYTGVFWRSALVASLFAVHPLRVESVVWAAERKDVLAGFFWMLALFAYYRYVQKPSALKMACLAFIFLLGLMSKPVLVTLPFVFLLLDYWPLKRLEKMKWQLLIEKIPLVALSIFSCVMSLLAARAYFMPIEKIALQFRVINAFISYGSYLKKTFVPYPLAHFYPHPVEHYSKPMFALSLLVLGLITGLAFGLWRRRPAFIVGWLWFLVTLFPMAGLVQVGRAAMADRYTYFPHIGLLIALVWLLPEIRVSGKPGISWKSAWLVLAILPLMAITFVQTGYWRESEILDRHTLEVTGFNPIVQSNLEYAVIDKGIQNKDVDALLAFIANSNGVQMPPRNMETKDRK